MPGKPLLLHVGHLRPSPRWRMAEHHHAFHELIVPVRGRMTLRCPAGVFSVTAGDVLLYPAGMPHEEETVPADPVESYFLSLRHADLPTTALRRRHDHSGRMRQIIRWLYDDQFTKDPLARAENAALFHALLAHFLREDQGPEPELVRRIREFARQHLEEPLTLDRLAREAGLSRFYFTRTYRRLAGLPPMKELQRLRLEYARDLVMATRLPLKEIAQKTGLGTPYSLSRLFHRFFGMPPGAFRRSFCEPD